MEYNTYYSNMLFRTVKGDKLIFDDYKDQIVKENHRKGCYFLTDSNEKIAYGDVDEVESYRADTGEVYTKFYRCRRKQ